MIKKVKVLFIIYMALMLVILSNDYYVKQVSGEVFTWGSMVIVIDAGHGGIDSGCSGNGLFEKDITLAISKHTASLLRACGIMTVCTRTDDIALQEKNDDITYYKRWALDLAKRVEIAEKAKANALVSIHINSVSSSRWRGAQVFYDSNKPDSKYLADIIQRELNMVTDGRRLSNTGNYYVTREAQMPSVIVEAGFISNPSEAKLLADEEYQKKIAWAIVSGILAWLQNNVIHQ